MRISRPILYFSLMHHFPVTADILVTNMENEIKNDVSVKQFQLQKL
jgi:hypothetical protein